MQYSIPGPQISCSFPLGDAFVANASADADVVLHFDGIPAVAPDRLAVLVELGTESLAVHIGDNDDEALRNVIGYSRYRNGDDAPSSLIELVVKPWTSDASIAAAQTVFEQAGFTVVTCSDQPGRIIDRLVRPKYNNALRLLDEGLASQQDIDLTCRLGLGYPDGPIERVVRGGLAAHHDISASLFEIFGTPSFAPARRAVVAKQRERRV